MNILSKKRIQRTRGNICNSVTLKSYHICFLQLRRWKNEKKRYRIWWADESIIHIESKTRPNACTIGEAVQQTIAGSQNWFSGTVSKITPSFFDFTARSQPTERQGKGATESRSSSAKSNRHEQIWYNISEFPKRFNRKNTLCQTAILSKKRIPRTRGNIRHTIFRSCWKDERKKREDIASGGPTNQ